MWCGCERCWWCEGEPLEYSILCCWRLQVSTRFSYHSGQKRLRFKKNVLYKTQFYLHSNLKRNFNDCSIHNIWIYYWGHSVTELGLTVHSELSITKYLCYLPTVYKFRTLSVFYPDKVYFKTLNLTVTWVANSNICFNLHSLMTCFLLNVRAE